MKKLILILLLAIAAQAGGLWDMVKNASSDGNLVTKQYTIEVSGVNTRGYTINVPDMRSICFMSYSSQGIPAMQCKTYQEMGMSTK